MKTINAQVVTLLRNHFPHIKFSVKELEVWNARGRVFIDFTWGDEVRSYLVLDTKAQDDILNQHRDCYYITYMGTKSKYRKQGLARGLLKLAKRYAQDKPIYTYVASFNVKELNLLTSEGFKVTAEVVRYKQNWLQLKYSMN